MRACGTESPTSHMPYPSGPKHQVKALRGMRRGDKKGYADDVHRGIPKDGVLWVVLSICRVHGLRNAFSHIVHYFEVEQ